MSKPKKPIIAIMYDFDKTLSTKDMQEYGFIPSLGLPAKKFREEAQASAKEEQMDSILAYLRLMLKKASEKGVSVRKQIIVKTESLIKSLRLSSPKWQLLISS